MLTFVKDPFNKVPVTVERVRIMVTSDTEPICNALYQKNT